MPQDAEKFSGIFINYRRDDSSGHAGRLFDRLSRHFGDNQVFIDIDHIEPGVDFVEVLEDSLGACEILVTVIGKRWLLSSSGDSRRLDDPNDFVRVEIAAALNRNIRVIPVLVDGATMPKQGDLPDDLSRLARRQAVELSDQRWNHDIERLITALEKVLAERREARLREAQEEEERQRQAAAAEELRRQQEERSKREEQERIRREEEERNKLEEEARLKLEAEEKRKQEEEARQREAEEERRRLEEEEKRKREAADAQAAEEKKRREAEEQKHREAEEELRREAEEEKQREAEALRRAEELEREKREAEESERKRREAEEQERARAAAVEPESPSPEVESETATREAAPEATPPAVEPESTTREREHVRQPFLEDFTSARPSAIDRRVLLAVAGSALVVAVVAAVWWSSAGGGRTSNVGRRQPAATPGASQPRDAATAGSIAPVGMVYVPGGEFKMGRDDGDEYERPAHVEVVKAFFIGAYEVTCEDYEKFVRETGRPRPSGWKRGACPAGAARKPATGATWDEADAFCRARGQRLPTEQEWEFAARGKDGRRYPWGNDWRAGLANADGASSGMVEVGSYPEGKSPFGAFDMVGNAWEWTASDLKAYPGGRLPGNILKDFKVIRSGSFDANRNQAVTTYRRGYPALNAPDYSKIGFRCVSVPPNSPALP